MFFNYITKDINFESFTTFRNELQQKEKITGNSLKENSKKVLSLEWNYSRYRIFVKRIIYCLKFVKLCSIHAIRVYYFLKFVCD